MIEVYESKNMLQQPQVNEWIKQHLLYSIKISTPNIVQITSIGYSIKKIVFVFIFILSQIGLSYQLYNLTKAALSKGVITEIKLNEAKVIYPDIVVCSYAPILYYKYNIAYKNADEKLRDSLSQIWKTVENKSSHVLKNSRLNFLYAILINSMMDNPSNYILGRNISSITNIGNEMIYSCKFHGTFCKPNRIEFDTFFHMERGMCSLVHVYNPGNNLYKEGLTNKLQLLLFKENQDFDRMNVKYINDIFYQMDDIIPEGFYVYAMEPKTYPDIGHYLPLPFRSKLTLGIQMTKKVQYNSVCLEDSNIKSLFIRGAGTHIQIFQYSELLCRKLFLQRQLLSQCGCLSFELPIPADISMNETDPLYCIWIPKPLIEEYSNLAISRLNLSDLLAKYNLVKKWNCYDRFTAKREAIFYNITNEECPVVCTSYSYQYRTSYEKWPRNTVELDRYLFGYLQKHASVFNVTELSQKYVNYLVNGKYLFALIAALESFVEINRGDSFNQIVELPIVTILSNFGSIIGLWTGASVVSVLELIEMIVLFVMQKYYARVS